MLIDKQQIKRELIDESNNILSCYDEQDVVDNISIMNTSEKVIFLGSLRVYNENNVAAIEKDVNDKFMKYGKLTVRDEKIIPCCAPKYVHISFNISVDNI